MGTNSKSSHASYAIAPSGVPEAVAEAAPAAPAEEQLSDEMVMAKTKLMVAMDNLEVIAAGGELAQGGYPLGGYDDLPQDPVEQYDIFVNQIHDAREAIEQMKAAGASDEEVQAELDALRAQSLAYLNALDPADLQQIAAAKGFEHPALVGLSGKGQHPLVHWLDPYYADGIKSKNAIQAAALKRYDQLVAGETVGGMTLADLHTIEGAPPVSTNADGTWTATPAQIASAAANVDASISGLPHPKLMQLTSEQLQEVLQAEHTLATAHSPDQGDELAQLQAQAKLKVDAALNKAYIGNGTVLPVVQAAVANGDLTETEAGRLKPRELVALMRSTTPEDEKQALKETALARQDSLTALDAALDEHVIAKPNADAALSLPNLADGPNSASAVVAWAKSTGEVYKYQQEAKDWIYSVLPPASDISTDNAGLLVAHEVDPKALTTEVNAWAKQQKLSDLRDIAGQLGMPDPGKASRAHVQNYIAASFNPDLDKEAINAKVAAAAAKKTAAAVPATSPATGLASDEAVQALKSKLANAAPSAQSAASSAAPTPSSGTSLTAESKVAAAIQMGASPAQAQKLAQAAPAASKPVPKAPVKPAKPGSFNAKVQALVANLQQVKATAQDVPVRIDSDVVGSWDLGPGTAANLGGTYSKTLHSAPDGSSWLFKADHHGHGAIAHAEAAASHALSLGGVPAVPVYVKKVNGNSGSVQPMLKGATHFSSDPHSWSQTEVDAIVRSHVGSWLVGDHDGHQQNVLRTASGGLVHIDRGQAFKHYGEDKLSLGYAPSGGGSFTPVHQKLYSAALSDGLGAGVKINPSVVHPIIKNFEAIPDSQWRSLLHSTAHEGAKAGVHWVPAMRKQAAKTHKVPASQVSHEQIAEAFLDHAVARKQGLRKAFADFFVSDLKMPTAASLKHGAN
ncbi:hypothetical protein OG689_44530 [Kitasatospora sp. NBC_00240]|uniref:hypothetical protein n=1 Tax=Kitasatospora sp. NBC_00240 TaxID=2903567 RepID=UPI002259EB58|nr:hypothetical protein [Kitasatospora sp. NBC_00240]MCX5216206.1 hypothetical protein [Kitasatospora sp. NBC_00240]